MNAPVSAADALRASRSLVIKVGSSLLVDAGRVVRLDWLRQLAAEIAAYCADGCRVTVVSSGAVALGHSALKRTTGTLPLAAKQAAAAVGQVLLANAWRDALAAQGVACAQILLTPQDTEHRRRHLNARDTLHALADEDIVPIINENDTVATDELRYGDNDRLAARVAQMIGADLLLLLSDVDGFYDRDPRAESGARHIPLVDAIDSSMFAMAGTAGSALGTGGMHSKLSAAAIATAAGTHVIVASGQQASPLTRLREGGRGSLFRAAISADSARRRWIAASLRQSATILVDDGAADALRARKSLLPVGVSAIEGEFQRGDCIALRSRQQPIGVGLVRMSSQAARVEIARAARGERTDVLVHCDDLVLGSMAEAS